LELGLQITHFYVGKQNASHVFAIVWASVCASVTWASKTSKISGCASLYHSPGGAMVLALVAWRSWSRVSTETKLLYVGPFGTAMGDY